MPFDARPVNAAGPSIRVSNAAARPGNAETASNQTFTVEIFNGKPSAGGTAVCTYTDGFSEIIDVISASANKVTSVSASTTAPSVGSNFTVTAVGDTGSTGSGPSSDRDGGNGVFSMAPAMSDSWPADTFTLTGVSLVLGGTTTRDRLRVYPTASGAYTATYSFNVRSARNTTTPIRPAQNIASGAQVKYTGSYDPAAQVNLAATTVTTSFSKGATAVTSGVSDCTGSGTSYYQISYEVTISNTSSSAAILDLIRDTPTPGSGVQWCIVTGQTQLAGSTIADPQLQSGALVFSGPYTIPAATGSGPGTAVLTYKVKSSGSSASGEIGTLR